MFKEELKLVPHKPGSYQMIDKNGVIIYVGKAKDLNKRLHSYFRGTVTGKTALMVSEVDHFTYIVTKTETESFILEINLIKKYNPKYNILLKDDKQYPYLKVTINEDWPKVVKTRTLRNDGAKYFGPYMGMSTIKNTMEIIRKIFMPPSCTRKFPQDIGKGRPCLNYHINKCLAPCANFVTKEEYNKVRDNSLPIEIRLVRDYFDSINSPVIGITNDTSDESMTLSISDKSVASEDSEPSLRYR